MSLSQKVIKSGFWLQVSKFLQLGANFIITAILARLLVPDDFGLVGIVTVYTVFITTFTSVGFGSALVQKQDVDQKQTSTLYWLGFAFGGFTSLAVALSAPLASYIYEYEELIPLIRLASINFLLTPFFRIHQKLMEKDLFFHTIAKINVAATIGSGLIGITFALLRFGVYSLIIQALSLNLIYLILYRSASRWKPQHSFHLRDVRDMIFFSLKMKGAQLTRFFERNIDLFLLGKLLSATDFGFYILANRIIYFPIRRVTYTFSEILFPSFSKIQDNLDKIKDIYLKAIQLIAIFIFPLIMLLALFSRPLVLLVLGEKWYPAADILSILAAVGALQSIEVLSVVIYPAINIPEISIKLGIIRSVVTGIFVFIGGLFGLMGAAFAILAAKTILFVISMLILKKYIKLSFIDALKQLKGPLLGVMFMCLIILIAKQILIQNLPLLLIQILLSLSIYCLLIFLINRKDLNYFFSRITHKT